MPLDFLPQVDKCCFCLDLKIGSILIAIYAIISAAWIGAREGSKLGCDIARASRGGTYGEVVNILNKIFYPIAIILIIAAIIFIVSLFINWQMGALIFTIALLAVAIVEVILCLVLLIGSITYYRYCKFSGVIVDIINFIIPLLYLYFAIVVNSFESEM